MSKTPKYDAAVGEILAKLEPHERTCALTGDKWMMDAEEISWIKKFNVPPPTWHPLTRMKITTAFATGFGWWWQKHPETGKPVLTYVHPATGIKAVPDPEFYEMDNTDKARDYDPGKPFNGQIRELQLEVPFTAWRSLQIPVNSVSLLSQGDENSYFVTGCRSKNSMYAYCAVDVEDSAELYESNNIVSSYNILNSHRLHGCLVVRQSFDCMNCSFIFDCRNCENCFGATNKRNKKFIWFNEQLSEEEWRKRRAEVDLGSREVMEEMRKKFQELVSSNATVWPENFNEKVENCVGEYLLRCEDCKFVYSGFDSKNCYWGSIHIGNNEGNAFLGGAIDSTNNWYSHAPLVSSGCKFVHSCYQSQNMEYSMQCYNCEDCFGCVGLNRKKFCIFNKQYTEEEYWKKVDEIKTNMLERGEYGDFFPLSFSPVYFFASPSLIYLIDDEDAKKLGALDYDPESAGALGDVDLSITPNSVSEIPDNIKDFDASSMTGVPFLDEGEGRRFSYIKPEIALYKQLGIAASVTHPMKRLRDLVFEANSAIFIDAKCDKCQKELVVSKNKTYPNRTIYCRECYLAYLETNG